MANGITTRTPHCSLVLPTSQKLPAAQGMTAWSCVQGLRTYLLAYGAFYHSLSQQQLAEMFDMTDKQVPPLAVPNPLLHPDFNRWGSMAGRAGCRCPLSACLRVLKRSPACAGAQRGEQDDDGRGAERQSWDQPTRTIVMHATNPSRLQVRPRMHACMHALVHACTYT